MFLGCALSNGDWRLWVVLLVVMAFAAIYSALEAKSRGQCTTPLERCVKWAQIVSESVPCIPTTVQTFE